MSKYSFDEIVSHLKSSGFVYQNSEIYGGLSNSWDYGIYGSNLKKNIKDLWWKEFIVKSPYNVGIDASILMNPKVWEVSGHVGGFADAKVDCKECKGRYRADQLIESQTGIKCEGMSLEEMDKIIAEKGVKCPDCGKSNFTNARSFNLMFKTSIGTVLDSILRYLKQHMVLMTELE